MKLKNFITGLVMLWHIFASAQNEMLKKADKLFNNFAFVQASNAYQDLINEGISTSYATRQLADTYAYLRNPDSAVVYYEKAVKQGQVPIIYYYNYSQALRGVKNYEDSRIWMKQFKESGGKINDQLFLKDIDFLNSIFNAKQQYVLKDVKFNSKYSDFGAYQHGDKIYFTSARDEGNIKKHRNAWDEEPFLNIYAINKNKIDTLIGNKSKLKGKVNSVYHDGPLTITKDGKTMYFSRTDFIKNILGRNGEGISNLKIYKASLIDGKWNNIKELPFNSNHFSNGHPALSADETKLYFASDRSGGYGGADIYYVDINDGSYGKPKNLGAVVNTSKNEKFPFINSEGTLFFSSDGHPGLGLLDIYGTASDENKEILSIINLGTPVNSSKDDFSFFMNDDGLSGFFASNRKGGVGGDDIYSFDRIPLITIEGTVYDDLNNEPLDHAIITILDENDNKISTYKTNNTGNYSIELEKDKTYKISSTKEGYHDKKDSISSKELESNINAMRIDFPMKSTVKIDTTVKTVKSVNLSPIYFNYNSASIRTQDEQTLDNIADAMMNLYPSMVIKIESYSDARGPEGFNYKLSKKRAKSTYNYLLKKGVNPTRIIDYNGYGENKLTNGCNSTANCTEIEHQQNRRTEFIIIKMN